MLLFTNLPNPSLIYPFSDILSTLSNAHSLVASYLRIRSLASSSSTGPSPELVQARTELESTLEEVSTDLQDLVDSVKAVEADPFQYGLNIDEVGRRRKLVRDIGEEIERMRDEIKRERGTNMSTPLPPPSAFDNPDSPVEEGGDGGDPFGAFEQQRQAEIMQEQDEALDGVFRTVGNLRQQAGDMGRELEEQVEMLEDMGQVADRVEGKLQNGMKRVGWILKRNEGEYGRRVGVVDHDRLTQNGIDVMSSCCITVLIFVLILLLVLLLIS